jgi:hypothetical protein
MDFEFSQKQSSRRKMLRDSDSLGAVPYWLNCFPEVFSAPFELRGNKPRRLQQIR